MTPKEIEILDKMIKHWRHERDKAIYYVDALQSYRKNTMGSVLLERKVDELHKTYRVIQ